MAAEFERPRSPEEIIAKLERKVGPEGRKIFERFLAQVARLQEKQQLELMGIEEAEESDTVPDATNNEQASEAPESVDEGDEGLPPGESET